MRITDTPIITASAINPAGIIAATPLLDLSKENTDISSSVFLLDNVRLWSVAILCSVAEALKSSFFKHILTKFSLGTKSSSKHISISNPSVGEFECRIAVTLQVSSEIISNSSLE